MLPVVPILDDPTQSDGDPEGYDHPALLLSGLNQSNSTALSGGGRCKCQCNIFWGVSQRGGLSLLELKSVVQMISLLLQFNGAGHFRYKPMILTNDMVTDIEQSEAQSRLHIL